jgi:hypothetical protein
MQKAQKPMIKLGRHSYSHALQRGTMNTVHVGNFTSIAEGVIFDGGFNHETKYITTFPLHTIWPELPSNIQQPKDIYIGHDVWIGEGCFIMAGVTIGNGAIIGCNSVVTKDVRPYDVVAGSPAKTTGSGRFGGYDEYGNASRYILAMLEVEWWSWSDEKIRENAELLISPHSVDFIKKHTGKDFSGRNF